MSASWSINNIRVLYPNNMRILAVSHAKEISILPPGIRFLSGAPFQNMIGLVLD